MIDHDSVNAWLARYVAAWESYEREAIGDLFSEDASYAYSPFDAPIVGREAIVADWLKNPDAAGSFNAKYAVVAIDGDLAVANGRTLYYEGGGPTVAREFDNIFVLRFDAEGRCREYREWYMQAPQEG
jgi:ketosteroid isomerase-like protein